MDNQLFLFSRCSLGLAAAFAVGALFGGRWKWAALAVAMWHLAFSVHLRFATQSLGGSAEWPVWLVAALALSGSTRWKYRTEALVVAVLLSAAGLFLASSATPLMQPFLPSNPMAWQRVMDLEQDRAATVAYLAFVPTAVFLLAWIRRSSGALPAVAMLFAVATPVAVLLSLGFPGIEPSTVLILMSQLVSAYALTEGGDGAPAGSVALVLLFLAFAGHI